MGHLTGKDEYGRLAAKVDGMPTRAPWNKALEAVLRELYSSEEAGLVAKLPYGPSNFERIQRITGLRESDLRRLLEGLCAKGLVMDLWFDGEYKYMISPLMVGFFEFSMMRTGPGLSTREWAELFHRYFQGDDSFFAANSGRGDQVFLSRVLPHPESLENFTEVLDYEKAEALVEQADKMAVGLCSCRHEKEHTGSKECDTPLDTCASFGFAADYLIRRGMAREVSRDEMKDNLARSRELGLVLEADNVRRNITFICQCCGCCCNMLLGLRKYGYTNIVVTSSFIAGIDRNVCISCGKCVESCPVAALEMTAGPVDPESGKTAALPPVVNEKICLGCGVCGLKCPTGAIRLSERKQRVLHPETTFERIILQALEKGTLQNQLFDHPDSQTQSFLRGVLGGFFRLSPVKRALMSETFRSTFLRSMSAGVKLLGKEWVTRL